MTEDYEQKREHAGAIAAICFLLMTILLAAECAATVMR